LLKTDQSQESQQHLNQYLLAKDQPAAELAGLGKVGQKFLQVLAPPPEEFRLDISSVRADRTLVLLVPKSKRASISFA